MGKKYTDYQVDDFLRDELFVKWVIKNENHINDFWTKWLNEHPEKVNTVKEASLIIQSMEYKNKASLSNGEYLHLYERIEESISGPDHTSVKRSWKMYQFAAVISLVILSGWFLVKPQFEPVEHIVDPVYNTKSTAYGEKLTIRLPDGSTAKLNAGSSITYQEGFSKNVREVQLEGEAIFEVVKDKSRPFTVHTTKMSVTALGTSFNVNSYRPNVHSVSLIEGKVSVGNTSSKTVVLTPGERAHTSTEQGFEITKVDIDEITAWSSGILRLNDKDFQEVISKLEKWYGVEISIKGRVPNAKKYEGTFNNESLESVLKTLSYSTGFKFEMREKTVKIIFN